MYRRHFNPVQEHLAQIGIGVICHDIDDGRRAGQVAGKNQPVLGLSEICHVNRRAIAPWAVCVDNHSVRALAAGYMVAGASNDRVIPRAAIEKIGFFISGGLAVASVQQIVTRVPEQGIPSGPAC